MLDEITLEHLDEARPRIRGAREGWGRRLSRFHTRGEVGHHRSTAVVKKRSDVADAGRVAVVDESDGLRHAAEVADETDGKALVVSFRRDQHRRPRHVPQLLCQDSEVALADAFASA